MTAGERVVVVGAGVAGLTTAVVLAEAGLSVHVIAEQVPGVTSLAAGAMWGPYLVEPKDKVDRWGNRSLEIFRELAEEPGHRRPAQQGHRGVPHCRGPTGLGHHAA
ncbi:glycine/D-amino acid oxidase-like deaminating enzyme [Streptomyces fulvorobeus]|uniref:D-amino-acid oxidase n=1 Tax=Streptomyces fulvorobeus TaxID=284028 RepID=A0A7Y9KU16_9ACTN|nr:glycine/D-amino acid oxidase-like deaminating enzyme [Streptomyces fulvorobeus]